MDTNNKENIPPPPASSPANANIPFSFLTSSQKVYMDEQMKAWEDERYFLERILGDLRDLLTSIHNYELRVVPDSNVPLFFDKEYTNFKKRIESYQLLQLVFQKIELFEHNLDIEQADETETDIDEEEEEDEAPQDTIHVYAI